MASISKAGTNTNSVYIGGPTLSTLHPPTNTNFAGLLTGEAIVQGDLCYIKSDGLVYRAKANLNAAPAAVTAASNASGTGLWNGGTHLVSASYVTAEGESLASIPTVVTITTTGQIRVSTFGTSLDASILSANFYVDGVLIANTAVVTAAIPQTDITGASLTLAGSPPPRFSSCFKDRAYMVDGVAAWSAASGEAVTLYQDVIMYYGAALTPGAPYWLSTTTAGGLVDVQAANLPVIARAIDATRIRFLSLK